MSKSKPVLNTLFPGRADYTGPTKGWFGLLHHDTLIETSHNVNERIDYIKRYKSKREVPIRLHNLIYLGGCDAVNALAPLDADYDSKVAALYADYSSKFAALHAEILCYIRKHIPDCAWDGEKEELQF